MWGTKSSSTLTCISLGLAAFFALALAQEVAFYESFTRDLKGRWIASEDASYEGVWKHTPGEGHGDMGLLVSQKAKKYGIATLLPDQVDFKSEPLVLQYDLRLQKGLDCGGAYLKFLMPQEEGWTPGKLKDATPYSIMFGPDKCGSTNKVHFIFRHKNPKTGKYVEHHLKNPPPPINDKLTHVYSAVVFPNNTVKFLIDGVVKQTADLLSSDFTPPVLPPESIPDPDDKKPDDWDERAKIVDPEAKKPDNWDESAPPEIFDESAVKPSDWLDDEPLEVDDPDAEKPADWEEEEDGEFEPPKVPNPKCQEVSGCGEWKKPMKKNPNYKGKWNPPMIDNPNYKGKWVPRDIPNPEYFHLDRPNLEPIAAIAIEIWSMNDGIMFDNILLTNDESVAEEYRETKWLPKKKTEDEIERLTKKKEEEKLKKDLPIKHEGFEGKLFEIIHKIVDKVLTIKFLAPYKSQIKGYVRAGEEHPQLVYAILAFLSLVFASIIFIIPVKRKTVPEVSVERVKKEDLATPDDAVSEEKSEKSDGKKQADEDKSSESESEDNKAEAKVRRRARRDN